MDIYRFKPGITSASAKAQLKVVDGKLLCIADNSEPNFKDLEGEVVVVQFDKFVQLVNQANHYKSLGF